MHDTEKSDLGIVAMKPTNKAGRPVAELVEPRPGTKGNAGQQSTHRAQDRARVTQALDRVRKAARLKKKERFTALLHHINVDALRTAFYALRHKAAAGVDGITWQDYEADLEPRLRELHARVHGGAYRPQPSRRTYIPKADGKQRPLAIAALEDKIVQGATVMVLNAIYEGDFCGFSYGFRPGRGPHDALDALSVAISERRVNWIMDADIQNFFGAVSQKWLVRFLEHRVGDKRIIRLIQKWLKAGILEDGVVIVDDRGTGQGSVMTPSSSTRRSAPPRTFDTITDFSVADDTIRLENSIFIALSGTGRLTADQFMKNTPGMAADSTDRIIYETDTGKFFYDSNGSAAGGSIHFATIGANLDVTAADFFIV